MPRFATARRLTSAPRAHSSARARESPEPRHLLSLSPPFSIGFALAPRGRVIYRTRAGEFTEARGCAPPAKRQTSNGNEPSTTKLQLFLNLFHFDYLCRARPAVITSNCRAQARLPRRAYARPQRNGDANLSTFCNRSSFIKTLCSCFAVSLFHLRMQELLEDKPEDFLADIADTSIFLSPLQLVDTILMLWKDLTCHRR